MGISHALSLDMAFSLAVSTDGDLADLDFGGMSCHRPTLPGVRFKSRTFSPYRWGLYVDQPDDMAD